MKAEPDFLTTGNDYASATRERMARSIGDLLNIQRAGDGDITGLLRRLHEQEEASRLAGYERIRRLCQTMEDCLVGIRNGEHPGLAAVITTLLNVCRAVETHAASVADTVIQLHGNDVRRGKSGGSAGPYATDDDTQVIRRRPPS